MQKTMSYSYLSLITRNRKRERMISSKLIQNVIYAKGGVVSGNDITYTTIVGLKPIGG